MFITSKIDSYGRVGDYILSSWKECGLLRPSMTRMKFATIDKAIIKKRLGTLLQSDQEKVMQKLKKFFRL
jgi:mRNA interferase MazF